LPNEVRYADRRKPSAMAVDGTKPKNY
jgi:hypothetical protein